MRKYTIAIIAVFQVFILSAQVQEWYGTDLGRVGYKRSTLTFENVPLTHSTNPQIGNFGTTEIKGGSVELSADIYRKNVYFSLDASTLIDVGISLFQFDRTKQRWWDNDNYYVLRSDILPMRLAFGSNIGKYVSLYAGGQYSLSSVGLSYKGNNISPYRDTRIGGNVYGFGGHAVFAYKIVHVRYSYMYNWISQSGFLFKGNSINNELVVSVGFSQVGIFAKFNHVYADTDGGYLPNDRTRLFKFEGEPSSSWQSAHYANQFQFSVGIYAKGLVSKMLNLTTQTVSETEKRTYQQRQEEKRRKVEYKE